MLVSAQDTQKLQPYLPWKEELTGLYCEQEENFTLLFLSVEPVP